jgi:hypothetical protein
MLISPSRRVIEVIPPAVVWLAVTAPAWAAVIAPWALGYFLMAFAAYWLWRTMEFAGGLLLGVWRVRVTRRRNWQAAAASHPGYDRLRHLVLIPTYRESEEILAETLAQLSTQTTPRSRISVVLAFEARDEAAPERARRLTDRFAPLFGDWLVTFHPDLPGEVTGKSSNLAWAARCVERELIQTGRLSADDLLVTVCDADSRLDRQYLSALAHATLSHRDGMLHVYQPALLFYANHWRLPAPLRAVNSVFSLYSLARLAAGHRLVPQSTYSLSWTAAAAVGFWDTDVIPEDSHMFFKLWLRLGKRVRTRAIYLPVWADAAEGATLQGTLTTHYRQIRRWAWGVSDIPYIVQGAWRARHIPWYVRLARVGWYIEEHLVWPSHWFILTLGGAVPPLLNPAHAATAAAAQQAATVGHLLSFCLPALILAFLADLLLRPRAPAGVGLVDAALGLVGFAALPVTSLVLSAAPALDAHTRLLLGRPLGYQVTEKLPSRAPNTYGRSPVTASRARRHDPAARPG